MILLNIGQFTKTTKHGLFYVYIHIRLDTGQIFYIGKGSNTNTRAFSRSGRNRYWHRIVNKCGGYEVKIICYSDTEQEALDDERYLISECRAVGIKLANVAEGGQSTAGSKLTDEHKEKLRVASSKNRHSETSKQKISDSKRGKKRAPFSPEWVEKIRKSSTGRKHSPETKKKISEDRIGNKHYGFQGDYVGTHLITGEVIRFSNGKELKDAGFDRGGVQKVVSGTWPKYKNYAWTREK